MILAAQSNSLIILLIIIGVFAVIAIATYVIYRLTHPKMKKDDKEIEKEKEQHLQEELDRVLQPVEDEKTAEEIKNYKSPEDDE